MRLKKYFIKRQTRENIEAEEIFLDAEAVRSIEAKGKLENPIKHRNFILFYIVMIIGILCLFSRTGYLQIIKGDYYENLAKGNRLRIYNSIAPRGIIYDRFNNPLVYNTPSFDLIADVADFYSNPEDVQDEILTKIAEIVPVSDLREKIDSAYNKTRQTILIKGIEHADALVFETVVNEWPGIRIQQNAQRQYILGPYFSHIIGYTGEVNESDLEKHPDYFLNDEIGKIGLEKQYQDYLRGQPGQEQIEVDSSGKTQRIIANKPSQPGNGLVLFVDKDLQEKLYQSLENMLKKLSGTKDSTKKAAAVAINPNNGGILALVSLPSFNNNPFAQGISQEDLNFLENNPNEPFMNRVLAGQYPSGSIIKPLIAAAALEENIISAYQKINCNGVISIGNEYNPQIVYNFVDSKAHGMTNMFKAIAESCNVFFYTIGGGYKDIEGLGVDRIKKYLGYFGLGSITGIDLPNEKSGLISNKEDWYLGDTYHLSIGQGDLLVTPLQMASAIASIANGGILYQPQLVDKIIDEQGNIVEDIQPSIIRQGFISEDNLKEIRKAMRETVVSGSAQSFLSLPIEVAGKTGTAQFGNNNKTHAWFASFAPYENSQIALIILIEGGGEGHLSANPVAKEVYEWYFSK
ncbi:MAG: penicillin-binding protein 2 [Patescibacteria group bacterium]|nr:penicillin-binding protein 2 [Patescibacteria group bacterium]